MMKIERGGGMLAEVTPFSLAPSIRFRFNTISRVASSENYGTFQLSGGCDGWGRDCQDSHARELTVTLKNQTAQFV